MVSLRDRLRAPRWVGPTVLLLAVSAQAATSQEDRVAVRTVPAPNQVVQMRASHDITMNVEGPPGLPVSGAIVSTTTMAGTMKVGGRNAQGDTEAEYTLDTFNIEGSFNGAPLPTRNVARDLVGQAVSIKFDDADNIVDVKSSNPTLRSLLLAGFFSFPKVTLAIGESTTVRNQMPLPLPAGLSPALNATLESTYTLQSIAREPAGRIAHFGVTTAGGMAQDPASPVSITVTITGSGTMDVNLDAGYVSRSEMTSTVDATVQPPAGAASEPLTVKMHGTMKMTGQADGVR